MAIKNFNDLIKDNIEREKYLSIIETGLDALNPKSIINNCVSLKNNLLIVKNKKFDLSKFENIYLLGIGKGSYFLSLELFRKIKKINEGYVIDVNIKKNKDKSKVKFFKGTHPLPSIKNLNFSKFIVKRFYGKTKDRDLFIIIICGGGSAMLNLPFISFETLNQKISKKNYKNYLSKYININQQLLKSGANIYEMNIIRKHIDSLKGGGLAKLLYPATIISLIISDVPGNDISIIASGPTVKDKSTISDAWRLVKKFKINNLSRYDLIDTAKKKKYFRNVFNMLIVNNSLTLKIMNKKAKYLGLKSKILTSKLKDEVKNVAKFLFNKIIKSKYDVLLIGGETNVKVKNIKGKGGRNQELVLWFLKYLSNSKNNNLGIIAINSDGWDNTPFAGAIGDYLSLEKAKNNNLSINKFLENNNSFKFFSKIKEGIITGRLPINISDIILVFKNK
ncbi:MAG: glycerate kinase [Candidatus Parcubacteria bacterium]|nr:MAG: glycerate kinase [Candidatus Parcubacteria bacterium]